MKSAATKPALWVSDENGTYDPEATCPHCDTGRGQVLGGSGQTARCRCTNPACARTFLHTLWMDPSKPRRLSVWERRGLPSRREPQE